MNIFIKDQKRFNGAVDVKAEKARKWNYGTVSTFYTMELGDVVTTPRGVAVIEHAETRHTFGLLWHLLTLRYASGRIRSYSAWSVDAHDDGYFQDNDNGEPLRYV